MAMTILTATITTTATQKSASKIKKSDRSQFEIICSLFKFGVSILTFTFIMTDFSMKDILYNLQKIFKFSEYIVRGTSIMGHSHRNLRMNVPLTISHLPIYLTVYLHRTNRWLRSIKGVVFTQDTPKKLADRLLQRQRFCLLAASHRIL